MDEGKIMFHELFGEKREKTKVKFNMNPGDRSKRAWDLLLEDSPEWIRMNAWKTKHANNNLNHADYLLAFAQYYPYGPEYYIFGGLYKVKKITDKDDTVGYELTLTKKFEQYRKRLIIKLQKPIGRDIYNKPYDSVIKDNFEPEIYELAPAVALGKFPGYNNVRLTHNQLSQIWAHEEPQWKQYLSCVKGVYCITDTATGKLYIGSASGKDKGLWQRWENYANPENLTGGNQVLAELKENFGPDYIRKNFTYTILEIFDEKTDDQVIRARESFWKNVFQTRMYGLNKN